MACPKCGCKTTYQYDDYESAFDLGSEVGYLQRCAACGEVFDIEDEAPEDEDEFWWPDGLGTAMSDLAVI